MARGLCDLRFEYSEPLKVLMALSRWFCSSHARTLPTCCWRVRRRGHANWRCGRRWGARGSCDSCSPRVWGWPRPGELGIGSAAGAKQILLRMISQAAETIPLNVSLNLRLLAFTCGVTICTAMLFGEGRQKRWSRSESPRRGSGSNALAGSAPSAANLLRQQLLPGTCQKRSS